MDADLPGAGLALGHEVEGSRVGDPTPGRPTVVATDAAIAEIRHLQAEYGPLELFQSGGCCDGSSPMCFTAGELRVGSHDLLVGEVEGCPFYVDAEQYERWGRPEFVLDVGPGAGSGMSLEGLHDVHFRLAACSMAKGGADARSPVTEGVAPP